MFNQGNNKQNIFFLEENYLYFLQKIRTYILPYSDILAWCLMPNHFHLMIYVKEEKLWVDERGLTHRMTPSHPMSKIRTLNQSIAIILRSYTRAINKQNNWSGSLFRPKTKAECVSCRKGITPSFYNKDGITQIHISDLEKEYPSICFNYIHENPVKAGLVKNEIDWEYSSAKDYYGSRNGNLVNKVRAKEFLNIE